MRCVHCPFRPFRPFRPLTFHFQLGQNVTVGIFDFFHFGMGGVVFFLRLTQKGTQIVDAVGDLFVKHTVAQAFDLQVIMTVAVFNGGLEKRLVGSAKELQQQFTTTTVTTTTVTATTTVTTVWNHIASPL